MRKCLVSFFAAILIAGMVQTTKADVVQDWNFTIDAMFTSWTNSADKTGTGINPNAPTGNTLGTSTGIEALDSSNRTRSKTMKDGDTTLTGYEKLRWGRNGTSDRSTLYKSDTQSSWISLSSASTTQQLVTDGEAKSSIVLNHHNHAVNAPTLSKGTITMQVQIWAQGVEDAIKQTITTSFDFFFVETTNTGNYQDDVFVVRNPVQANQTFMFGGEEYELDFSTSWNAIQGQYLTIAQNAFGFASDVDLYGIITKENSMNTLNAFLKINHNAKAEDPYKDDDPFGDDDPITNPSGDDAPSSTPEPATMLIMCLGLAGAGYAARRRKNA